MTAAIYTLEVEAIWRASIDLIVADLAACIRRAAAVRGLDTAATGETVERSCAGLRRELMVAWAADETEGEFNARLEGFFSGTAQ